MTSRISQPSTSTRRTREAAAAPVATPVEQVPAARASNAAAPLAPSVTPSLPASAGAAKAVHQAAPSLSNVGSNGSLKMRVDSNLSGATFVPTDAVRQFLATYEPDGVKKVGRPMERMLEVTARIHALVGGETNPARMAETMMSGGMRNHLFQLEAQLRLYAPRFGKSAENALDSVKQLEDALGAWGLRQDLLKAVDGKPVPKEVLAVMRQDELDARAAVVELAKDEWTARPDNRGQVPALNKMVKKLVREDWPSYAKDKELIREQMAEHIDHTRFKKLDLDDLQGGIHELRRQLRWIPLAMLSAGGAVQLSESRNPLPALKPLLQDKEALSPFARMPDPAREQDPIQVSKSLYLANSKLIARLGEIKDRGETVEYVAMSYAKAGLAKNAHAAEPDVRKLLGNTDSDAGLRAEAKAAFKEFQDQGVLKALAKDIRG